MASGREAGQDMQEALRPSSSGVVHPAYYRASGEHRCSLLQHRAGRTFVGPVNVQLPSREREHMRPSWAVWALCLPRKSLSPETGAAGFRPRPPPSAKRATLVGAVVAYGRAAMLLRCCSRPGPKARPTKIWRPRGTSRSLLPSRMMPHCCAAMFGFRDLDPCSPRALLLWPHLPRVRPCVAACSTAWSACSGPCCARWTQRPRGSTFPSRRYSSISFGIRQPRTGQQQVEHRAWQRARGPQPAPARHCRFERRRSRGRRRSRVFRESRGCRSSLLQGRHHSLALLAIHGEY
jgi:hypothetical protein